MGRAYQEPLRASRRRSLEGGTIRGYPTRRNNAEETATMSDVTATASSLPPAEPIPNLLSRAIGVITSPGATFAHVARVPKVAGMLFLVSLVLGLAQGLPQLTERGRAAALEMQVQQMDRFGVTVTDEMYQQMEQRSHSNLGAYISIISMFVAIPFGAVIMTVLLWVAFNTIMRGTASFKHVMAVVAHSQSVTALGALIAAPIMYAQGVMRATNSITNLGALLPMLDETSFLAKLLGGIDLFVIWWVVVLAIGLTALYRKKTSSIATGLFIVYGLILIVVAYFTAG